MSFNATSSSDERLSVRRVCSCPSSDEKEEIQESQKYVPAFSPMNSPQVVSPSYKTTTSPAYSPTSPGYVPVAPLRLFPHSPPYTPAPEEKGEQTFMVFSPGMLDRLLKAPRSSKKDPHSPLSPTEDGIDRVKLRWGQENLDCILPWARARFAPGRLLRIRAAKKREAVVSAKKREDMFKKTHAKLRFAQREEDLLCTERL